MPASGIPYATAGFRWCEEPEVASPVGAEPTLAAAAATRPPVVRTSRGRAQVLPSRFNDSVLIDPWKKEKPPAPPPKVEQLIPKSKPLCRKGAILDRTSALSEVDEDEGAQRYRACQNFVASRKYSMSLSTLTSLHDEPYSGYHRNELMDDEDEEEEEDRQAHKEDLHWSTEFLYGDIVWARLGKRQPAWPGVVVDPARQAAADAMPPRPRGGAVLCVMLFGWRAEFSDEKVH